MDPLAATAAFRQPLHPCHCTGLAAKVALSKVADVRETGVGLHLEYE
jgi:metal-dependent hydrolase (beta-lactamase superfamily II)